MRFGKEITRLSAEAAQKAARLRREPMMAFTDKDKEVVGCPNLGSYRPKGWILVNKLFVDNSGFGANDKPSLIVKQFINKVKEGLGYAVIEQGQFQVYIGVFRKN